MSAMFAWLWSRLRHEAGRFDVIGFASLGVENSVSFNPHDLEPYSGTMTQFVFENGPSEAFCGSRGIVFQTDTANIAIRWIALIP